MEINIGTEKDPKLIKIGKCTSKKERNGLINLFKEYRDALAFSYDELKAYREDVFQRTILLTEEAKEVKPFQQNLRWINPNLAPIMQKEI